MKTNKSRVERALKKQMHSQALIELIREFNTNTQIGEFQKASEIKKQILELKARLDNEN